METNDADGHNRKDLVNELLNKIPDYIQKIKCDTTKWTAPFKCAVLSCHNTFYRYDPENEASYKFHNFPDSADLHKVWLQNCRLPENFDTWSVKVCSEHFSLDDYERNYKEEMINPNFKRRLKNTAVPSLNLEGPEAVVKLPENTNKIDIYEVKSVVEENDSLKQTLNAAESKHKEMLNMLKLYEKKIAQKQKDCQRMKLQFDKLKQRASNVRNHKNMLAKVFSVSQINVLLGKKKVVWSDDDLAMAFTLRQMGSLQCYLYLKRTLNMPLPALSCVQKWAASIDGKDTI